MAYYGKRTITLNANSVITATVADYPAYVKLTPTNCPSVFYAGVDATKIKFTSDSAGTTQLDHELINSSATVKEYFVKTSAWTIYFWLGDDDEADTSNATGVWGTAKYIGHFITDANDSSANGNDGTVDGATLTADEDYLGGQCYVFDGSNDTIYLPDNLLFGLTTLTVISTVYSDSSSTSTFPRILGYRDRTADAGDYWLFVAERAITYNGAVYDTSQKECLVGGEDNQRVFIANSWESNTKNRIFLNGTFGIDYAVDTATLGNNKCVIGNNYHSSNYLKGKIGFMWIFSDAKSDDFISAVYNNLEDYDNFVTIGSEGVLFTLGTDKPIIKIFDTSGNVLDNSLDNGTYISFGTLPRGYATWVDIYIGEFLGFPIYNAVLSGIESDNQIGEAADTYQALSAQIGEDVGTDNWTDLPITLGTVAKGDIFQIRLRYDAGDEMDLGVKVFGIQVEGDWSG